MKQTAKTRIMVLVVSLVLFAGGVYALSLERGTARTALLVCSFAGLLAVAVWQTLNKRDKGQK